MPDLDDVASRITVRLDKEMREGFAALKRDHYEQTGAVLEDARLLRMLLRRALNSDLDRAAVTEALSLTYRINQLVVARLIRQLERDAGSLVEEARKNIEDTDGG